MDNRVYYGQYSLWHWIELILKQNIILPEYQRFFVWEESDVSKLIETFKKGQFVPPVTIGAYKLDGNSHNLLLDGQQRLTSILLAYLDIYPDKAAFKAKNIERLADENDNEVEDYDDWDNILDWNFKTLTIKGKSKNEILAKIISGNYKDIRFNVDENFLKNNFLGFSYLVPNTDDKHLQLKFYSSVFRNINNQGKALLPQESRSSLYFLNEKYKGFFDPEFCKTLIIKNASSSSKTDFIRFLSSLSQYSKDGNTDRVARGYASNKDRERYYEEYIYSVVGEQTSHIFKDFSDVFPDGQFMPRIEYLARIIDELDIPKQFGSIIEVDIYLFGLIYEIVFRNKTFDVTKSIALVNELESKILEIKSLATHTRAPGALKYLKARINASIDIYEKYINE